jgi:O-antigen ligase
MTFEQLLHLIFGAVIFLYFLIASMKYPMIPAAIYPFTFLNFTQTTLAVAGVSPSKYIGLVLILVGFINLLKEIKQKAHKNYSLLGFFFLLMLLPVWILFRFLAEGSNLNLALTFMLNALTVFSIVVIVNTEKRKRVMETCVAVTFVLLSLGMIATRFLPGMSILRSLHQGEYSRAIGFVNDPNFGGAFIAIGFAYFFSKAVCYYDEKKMKWLFLSLVLILISTVSLILTVSRAAILSVVVCLLVASFYGRIRFENIIWFLPSVVILFVVLPYFPDLIDAFKYRISIAQTDPSNMARIEFFHNGIKVIRGNFLFGVGDYTGYHSTFIDLTVFGGVFALGFFLTIIVSVFRINTRILAVSDGSFRDAARFVVLGLIVFLFNSLFIGMETERIVWFLFGWGMINFILFRKSQSPINTAVESSLQPPVSWTRDEQVVI